MEDSFERDLLLVVGRRARELMNERDDLLANKIIYELSQAMK
jgi:hypothetical protein